MILGILQIIGGIAAVIAPFMDQSVNQAFSTVLGIGAIICGAIMYVYGYKVHNGSISAKIDILAAFVRIAGITTIIAGVFTVIANVIIGADVATEAITAIVTIVIGLIIIFISTKINDGKQTTGDKIIWVLLMIIFIIDVILSVFTIVAGLNPISLTVIVTGICDLLVYIFMVILLCDKDVKSEMGLN
jgi:hypothetical protein